MNTKSCVLCKLIALFAGLGALNWFLVAFANVNIISTVFGDMTGPAKILYTVIGVAGIMTLISIIRTCPLCTKKCG